MAEVSLEKTFCFMYVFLFCFPKILQVAYLWCTVFFMAEKLNVCFIGDIYVLIIFMIVVRKPIQDSKLKTRESCKPFKQPN